MAIDADKLPREGLNSQYIVDNMSDTFGSNNTMDVIMSNLPRVACQIGAKPPVVHVGHEELNIGTRGKIQQNTVENQMPPNSTTPDRPKVLHVPPAKMMPGSDTKPGTAISKEDIVAFEKIVGSGKQQKMNILGRAACQQQISDFDITTQKPEFFKDAVGNQYKLLGGNLYVMGWQDAKVKVRLVNEKTGREIPTNGKKFQIYGWHIVSRLDESNDKNEISSLEKADDIERLESDSKIEVETEADDKKIKEFEQIENKEIVSTSKNEIKNIDENVMFKNQSCKKRRLI